MRVADGKKRKIGKTEKENTEDTERTKEKQKLINKGSGRQYRRKRKTHRGRKK